MKKRISKYYKLAIVVAVLIAAFLMVYDVPWTMRFGMLLPYTLGFLVGMAAND